MPLVLVGHDRGASNVLDEGLAPKQHVLGGGQNVGVANGARRVVLIVFLKGIAHSPHSPGRLNPGGPNEGLDLGNERVEVDPRGWVLIVGSLQAITQTLSQTSERDGLDGGQ